jgi:5-methylcytosine-specific restriction endonuclease McrA
VARTHGRKGRPWEALRRRVIARDMQRNPTCPRCGKALDPDGAWPARHPLSLSVDHIVPLSVDRSRAHDPSNLRTMHFGCNSSRNDATHDRIKRSW